MIDEKRIATLLNYQKISENLVALTKEEYKRLLICEYKLKELKQARKKTATEVIAKIIRDAVHHINGKHNDECFIEISFEKLDEIAKQYRVEV